MCQAATNSLGSGNSDPPSGEQAVKSSTGTCPHEKRPAAILVEVYEGKSGNLLKDVKVSLTGPSSGVPADWSAATKYVNNLDPGDNYEVSIAYDHLAKFKSGRLVPDKQTFKLGPGQMRRVIFRLHPPSSVLVVQVVDQDTGKAIPKERFKVVVPGIDTSEYTNHSGTMAVSVPPGLYEKISLELDDLQSGYRVAEMGKANVTAGEKGEATVKLAVKSLVLDSVDHHFVPGVKEEKLRIRYGIRGFSEANVALRVVSDQHNPPVVFERGLTSEEKANGTGKLIEWDGQANCASGPLQGRLVNPLYGPYKVHLAAPADKIQTEDKDQTATRVLIHSLKLVAGSYVENPRRPPAKVNPIPAAGSAQWADHIKWVQFRLNSLGYFAGAVDGTLNDQTKRAIKRYTYEMVNSDEHDRAEDPAFVQSLNTLDLAVVLFSEPDVLEDSSKPSKVYVQHNYFYHTAGKLGTTNWNKPDAHAEKDAEKLDRFETPIEAVITLEARDQKTFNAGHPGVKSPEAVGELEVEWTVIDPPEDTSVIPPFVANTSPTSGRDYIQTVRAKVTGVPVPTATTGGDNCPADCGGFDRDFFVQVIPSFTVRPGASNEKAISKVHQDASRHPQGLGMTAVNFQGSYIGGDNFVVKAAITFDGRPNKAALESEHATFQTAASFEQILCAQTGVMTVWRKRRACAVIDWMETLRAPLLWAETVSAFQAAFVELETAGVVHKRIDHFVTSQTDAKPFLDTAAVEMNKTGERDGMVFNPRHMFPFPLERGKKEQLLPDKEMKGKKDKNTPNFKLRVNGLVTEFNGKLTRITLGSDGHTSVGEWLAPLVRKTRRPGIIVLRALPFAGIDLEETTGLFKKKIKTVQQNFGRNEGSSCTGVGGGVAYLCEGYLKTLKDGYLATHEIAHCSYLSHPFQAPVDHDMADKNCAMWYLHSDKSDANRPPKVAPVDMRSGSPNIAKFCGKCLLKLRGWKVADDKYTKTPAWSPLPATPCNPVMTMDEYRTCDGSYMADNLNGGQEYIPLAIGAADPKDTNSPKIVLGPLRFLHVHTLKWQSTDGNLKSLEGMKTQERVTFNQPTQASPFCDAADPDQKFVQKGEGADKGECHDDHSVMLPALICAQPPVLGSLIAEQWYEYSIDGTHWEKIPGAAFLLKKEVFHNGTEWVLKFVKENLMPDNPNHFLFEVHYKIGPKPFRPPLLVNNSQKGTPAKPFTVKGSTIYISGDRKASYDVGKSIRTTNAALKALGVLAASDPGIETA